jgi:TPR repeat protein
MKISVVTTIVSFAAWSCSAIANDCDAYLNAPLGSKIFHSLATACISQAVKSQNPRDLFVASGATRNSIIHENLEAWFALYGGKSANPRLAQRDLENARSAINLLERSADRGYIEAQYDLGRILSGKGSYYYDENRKGPAHLSTLLDFDRALQWFRKAAARGHAQAQVEAAVLILELHAKGSLDEAVKYLTSAARQGNRDGATALARFFRTFSDDKTADIVSEAWHLYALDLKRDEARSRALSGTSAPLLDLAIELEERLWRSGLPPLSANESALAKTLAQEIHRAEFDDWGLPLSVKAALRLRDRAEKEFKSGRKMLVI